jgi:hypothetical protein
MVLLILLISPSLSFIVDPYDATYKQQGIFTESELQEIKDYNPVVMESLPQDLVDYLMLFDCVCKAYAIVDNFCYGYDLFNLTYFNSAQLKNCAKHALRTNNGTILSTGPNISIMIGFEGQWI